MAYRWYFKSYELRKMNILFTCAGRRNYLIRYFREAFKGGNMIAADLSPTAPALAEADIAVTVPEVDDPGYIEELCQIVKMHDIKLIISLNDLELPVLAKNRAAFDDYNCRVLVSGEEVIDTCFDKLKTIRFANELQIQVPETYTNYKSALEAISDKVMNYPLVVKPRWGSSSIGLEFPEDEEELKLAYDLINHRLDRSILSKASSADRKNAIIIQRKINGNEYGVDVINNLHGEHVAVIVKKKLGMRAGETDKAMTVRHNRLKKMASLIGEKLGHIGNLDCDFFEDDNGELYLLEMNPRFGGGYPFSHEAGANLPKAIYCWLQGKKASDKYFQVKENSVFSKCDNLIKVNLTT